MRKEGSGEERTPRKEKKKTGVPKLEKSLRIPSLSSQDESGRQKHEPHKGVTETINTLLLGNKIRIEPWEEEEDDPAYSHHSYHRQLPYE